MIIGTIENTSGIKHIAGDIKQYILAQLVENIDFQNKYDSYTQFKQYLETRNIPFEFTMEGKEILASKNTEYSEIEKTTFIDSQGRLQTLEVKEDLEKRKSSKIATMEQYCEQKREQLAWNEVKRGIYEKKSKEEVLRLIKGEEIADIIRKTEIKEDDTEEMTKEKMQLKSRLIIPYLLEVFDDNNIQDEKQSDRLTLLNHYMMLKEKAIAKDAKEAIEKHEKGIYEKIERQGGNVDEKE